MTNNCSASQPCDELAEVCSASSRGLYIRANALELSEAGLLLTLKGSQDSVWGQALLAAHAKRFVTLKGIIVLLRIACPYFLDMNLPGRVHRRCPGPLQFARRVATVDAMFIHVKVLSSPKDMMELFALMG